MSLWMIGAAAWSIVAPAQQQKMNVDDAIAVAMQNAFSVRSANANLEKIRAQVQQAMAQLFPQLSAGATYTRFDKQGTANFNGQTIITSPIDSKVAKLQVSFPIDISGNIGRGVSAARASERAGIANIEAAKNDLRLNVRNSYYSVLQAEAQVSVAQEALDRAREELKNANAEFQAGTKAKVDVMRLEAQEAQAQTDLIIANNSLDLAKKAFNNALARPIETPVELAEEQRLPAWPDNEQVLVDQAEENRPEVISIKNQVEALTQVRKAQERGLSPTLAVSAVHTRNIDAVGFSSQAQQTSGTLALNFPIFDGGLTRARTRAARQDEELAKIQLDQVKLGISLEVRQALTNMQNAKSRLDVATKAVEAAQEVYRISQVRSRAGEAISLEVTDAQSKLTQARTSFVAARYDYLKAYAALRRATGADTQIGTDKGKSK